MSSFIGTAFIILAILLIPVLVVGLIWPAKLAKEGELPLTRKKIAGCGIAWFFLLAIIGVAVLPDPQQAPQTKDVPSQSAVEGDLMKFTSYHKKLVKLLDALVLVSDNSKAVFASKNLDQFKMYEAANSSYETYSKAYRNFPEPPEFQDETVQKEVDRVSELFKNSILMRASGFEKLRKAADDGQLKPSSMSEIKELIERANELDLLLATKVFMVYEHFKISSDQVDVENGGLKK